MSNYGFTNRDCKIILNQIERRAKYRQEFLKMRTDPCKHAMEAGYVFDPAIQKFVSMKVTQLDNFQANFKNGIVGVCMVALPMAAFGLAVWTQRQKFEKDCRCGLIKYRDRRFKLA